MYGCAKNRIPTFSKQPEQVYRQTDSIEIITYSYACIVKSLKPFICQYHFRVVPGHCILKVMCVCACVRACENYSLYSLKDFVWMSSACVCVCVCARARAVTPFR